MWNSTYVAFAKGYRSELILSGIYILAPCPYYFLYSMFVVKGPKCQTRYKCLDLLNLVGTNISLIRIFNRIFIFNYFRCYYLLRILFDARHIEEHEWDENKFNIKATINFIDELIKFYSSLFLNKFLLSTFSHTVNCNHWVIMKYFQE